MELNDLKNALLKKGQSTDLNGIVGRYNNLPGMSKRNKIYWIRKENYITLNEFEFLIKEKSEYYTKERFKKMCNEDDITQRILLNAYHYAVNNMKQHAKAELEAQIAELQAKLKTM